MNGKGLALRNVTSTRRPHPRFPRKEMRPSIKMKTIFRKEGRKEDIDTYEINTGKTGGGVSGVSSSQTELIHQSRPDASQSAPDQRRAFQFESRWHGINLHAVFRARASASSLLCAPHPQSGSAVRRGKLNRDTAARCSRVTGEDRRRAANSMLCYCNR